MQTSILRTTRVAILTLAALALAACASAPPEAARGPAATAAEITEHLSDTTFSAPASEWHFASDGSVKSFDPSNDSRMISGRWSAEIASGADLLVLETTAYRLKRGKVTTDEQKESHRVFMQPDGSLMLDRVVDGEPDGTTTRLWNPRKGFPHEAEFAAAEQRMIDGGTAEPGQASRTDGASAAKTAGKVVAGAVGVTALVALCAGTMFLLCPL